MTRITLAALAVTLSLSLAVDAADGDARAIAEELLTAGAKLFDARDARGLAATYTDDAVIRAISRDGETRALKTEDYHGRAEIEKAYGELFQGDATFHAKNTIEYVTQPGPDVLVIAGHFVPDAQAADPIKVPFVQVRKKQGDAWKISTLQLFLALDQ
jgi:ketosteroid isomerase-like protein